MHDMTFLAPVIGHISRRIFNHPDPQFIKLRCFFQNEVPVSPRMCSRCYGQNTNRTNLRNKILPQIPEFIPVPKISANVQDINKDLG